MAGQTERNRPNESITIASPVNATELLGRDIEEGYDLQLGHAPIHVVTTEGLGGGKRYTALVDAPLTGTQFLKFLSATSSEKYEGDMLTEETWTADIMSDWDLAELAHGDNEEEIRLLAMHQTLGSAWNIFDAHRGVFRGTIYHPFYVYEGLRDAMVQSGERERNLTENVCLNPQVADLVEDYGDIAFRQLLLGLEEDVATLSLTGNEPNLERYLALRATLLQRLGQMDRRHRSNLLASYDARTRYIFPEDTDPNYTDYETARPISGIEVDVEYPNYGVNDLGNVYAAKALVGTNREGGIGVDVLPGSVQNANILFPVLRWKRNKAGKREWDFSPISPDEERVYRTLIKTPIPAGLNFDNQRFNTVVGALAAAYYQPDIRDTWPKERGLPGADAPMVMGPAQIPVLALMKRNQLLGSELIDAMEMHSEKPAA